MPNYEPLNQIKALDLAAFCAELKSDSKAVSIAAGETLLKTAASFGLSVRDYLVLAVKADAAGLDGYEQTLCELNLPVKDNYKDGVYLQAASETFQTFAGTRALFPEVIDDVLRFATRQDNFEVVAPMLSNSRAIQGNEMLSTVVDAEADADTNSSFAVPELGRIPVRTIRTSETRVKIWKHGSGLTTSYEFSRRASLDLLVPHANRIARELELSKVKAATLTMVNGDGVNAAAGVDNQSTMSSAAGSTPTAGQIDWQGFTYWLVQRAKAGVPVDTVVMNWDGIFQWMMLFSKQDANNGASGQERMAKAGQTVSPVNLNLFTNITPVISSSMGAGKILGYTRGDTLEELVENGSDIQESERNIFNQSITLLKTENTGYHLVYGDTRKQYDFAA